ncbi:MAG TPA: glycosyltransferase, partial [Phycisphaerales bacterium]|nr:glycosyltransferase [Phycisphaerales bacterium]
TLRAQIFARLGITEADRPLFMSFVANNFRLKGLTPLIAALARSRSQGRPVFLIVAGAGKSGRYRLLARRLNVHERIVFLGPVRHVQNVLTISEVAVLPTFYDPSSRFILEALAAGRPVITTRYNGAADLFVDKVHGRVVDSPDNIEALAEAITHFSDESNIRAASQAIVADDLRKKVCVDRVAGQLIELYERILAHRGERRY